MGEGMLSVEARFARSYIDRLFSEKDYGLIHHLISVIEMQKELPEEFWLFCRIFEWAPSRSGVWQYYEGLPSELFERVEKDLDRFELVEIAEKYRIGKAVWEQPEEIRKLDKWQRQNASRIHDAVFGLIAPLKDDLYL
jgi:hypothetical protein